MSVREGGNSRVASTRCTLPDGWVQLFNRNGYLYQPTGTRVSSRWGVMEHQELMQQMATARHKEHPSTPALTVEMSSRDTSDYDWSEGENIECRSARHSPVDSKSMWREVDESETLQERDSAQQKEVSREGGDALSVMTAAWEADLKLLEAAQAEIKKLQTEREARSGTPPEQCNGEDCDRTSQRDTALIASLSEKIESMKSALDADCDTQLSAKRATFAALRASRERRIDIRTVEEELRVISLVQFQEVEAYVSQMKGRVADAMLRLKRQSPPPLQISSDVSHGGAAIMRKGLLIGR